MTKEGIATRVSRIISGSLNALIDAVENAAPTVVMEEAIREVEATVSDVRSELYDLQANRRMASTRLMEENQRHEELAEKVALAVEDDRDDLARAAIAQQLDLEAQFPVLERVIAETSEKERELEGYLKALQAKKREMVDQLKSYISSRSQATAPQDGSNESPVAGASSNSATRRAETATHGFKRILNRQTGLASSANLNPTATERMAELDELARKNRVQERLMEIKRKKS